MLSDHITARALRRHFLIQDGLIIQINFGRMDMLLYYLDSYLVSLTEMSSKGQNGQCAMSVLIASNTIGKPGLSQQNNFSDLTHHTD